MYDAAGFLKEIVFSQALPLFTPADGNCSGKATAIHVHCGQMYRHGERLSQHWHDIARLNDCGVADRALADHGPASLVAHHKTIVFPEKAASGDWIDYQPAVSGGLQLAPTGASLAVSADDYKRMLADGMPHDQDVSFERLMQ